MAWTTAHHTAKIVPSVAVVLFAACSTPPVDHSTDRSDDAGLRLSRVAGSLQQPLVIEGEPTRTWSIEERMRQFSVPGVSLAVIDDFEVAASGVWGVLEAGHEEAVTTETIFQAGSISKPVAALLALSLVGDGSLALDQPVNDILRSWKVPDNEFTDIEPVTLRHVITHQAGFTPAGYLIPRSDGEIPGMAELLTGGIDGWPAVAVEFEPGSRHAYSNAGYCVLQLALEDFSGSTLHELASSRMFGPLGMTRSTFDEPLAPDVLASAASGHQRKRSATDSPPEPLPVEGKAEIAPGATGGLWSTPTDLALLAVEVTRAYRGESDRLLSRELATEFLTPQVANEGLGIYVEGNGAALRARHGGGMVGFIANLVFYPNVGKGAVVMANSEGGRWLNQELTAAIAAEYGWPDYPVHRSLGEATPEQLRELVGVYSLDASPDTKFSVTLEDGKAIGQINQYPPFELKPTTDADLYVLPRESLEICFRRSADGKISDVTLRRAGDAGNSYSRRANP